MPPDTPEMPGRLSDLQQAFDLASNPSIQLQIAMLLIGGLLALYLRFLYHATSRRPSVDSIARVFPLLTLVTIAVISIVKSSLALSLGLVGALSIVRFRAAIKDPEELVYLFLCIGVGLGLGASQFWLVVALMVVASVFALVFDRLALRRGSAFLTLVGPADRQTAALAAVDALLPRLVVERCDVDGDSVQLRLQVFRVDDRQAPALLTQLRESLEGFDLSYVNAASLS